MVITADKHLMKNKIVFFPNFNTIILEEMYVFMKCLHFKQIFFVNYVGMYMVHKSKIDEIM